MLMIALAACVRVSVLEQRGKRLGVLFSAVTLRVVPVIERDVQRHAAGERDRQEPDRGEGGDNEAAGGHGGGILHAARRYVNRTTQLALSAEAGRDASRHLQVLRAARLVEPLRQAQRVFYPDH